MTNIRKFGEDQDFAVAYVFGEDIDDPKEFEGFANKAKLRSKLPQELQQLISRIKVVVDNEKGGKVLFYNNDFFPFEAHKIMAKWTEITINNLVFDYHNQAI